MGLLRWKRTAVIKELPAMTNLEEASLVVADKNLAITKNTPYEELVKKIKSEPVNVKRDIFRQIMAAYFFLRVVIHMTHRPIMIEEFEIVQQRLKELAAQAKNKSRDAEEFLAVGYFTHWEIYWMGGKHYIHPSHGTSPYFIEGPDKVYSSFNPESLGNIAYIKSEKYTFVFPPNIIELMNEIYAKRYSDSSPRS